MSIKENLGEVIEELIEECPSPGKHAARSAIRHISKAFDIKDVDKEMAFFRGITGEEESATAIFHAIMRRKYSGAEKCDVKSHLHKIALHPFLLAVGKIIEEGFAGGGYSPTIEHRADENPKRLKTRITIKVNGEERWAYPSPPLNFNIAVNGVVHDFSKQLLDIATEKNSKNIDKYVRRLAKRRYQILYATSEGVPSLNNDIEPFLTYRESVIYTNLAIYLLIDPYKERQPFVQQCVDAFTKMLPYVKGK